MVWQMVKTLVVLLLLGAVGWQVIREAGWATATCVGLIFGAITALDRRTRSDPEAVLARVRKMVRDLGADADRMPGFEDEEGGGE